MDRIALLAAAATVILWASAFPVMRFALASYHPLVLALLRLLIGGLALALWAAVARIPPPALRDLPALLGFGLVGIAAAGVTLVIGLRSVGAGAGSFLVGTIPVFSALLARFTLGERIGPAAWGGIGISFVGIALIAFGEGDGPRLNAGAAWIVASAFCQALYYVAQRPYLRRYSPLRLTCAVVPLGALCTLPLLALEVEHGAGARWPLTALMLEQVRTAPLGATVAVAYLGLFPIAAAFIFWSTALARAKAAQVTSAMYAMPLLAMSLGYVWLGEIPGPLSLAGGTAALAGVALVALRSR
jgi:drug/metabolite transporter (DMT)-like permease